MGWSWSRVSGWQAKTYVLCMVGKWITLGVVLLTYYVDIELLWLADFYHLVASGTLLLSWFVCHGNSQHNLLLGQVHLMMLKHLPS